MYVSVPDTYIVCDTVTLRQPVWLSGSSTGLSVRRQSTVWNMSYSSLLTFRKRLSQWLKGELCVYCSCHAPRVTELWHYEAIKSVPLMALRQHQHRDIRWCWFLHMGLVLGHLCIIQCQRYLERSVLLMWTHWIYWIDKLKLMKTSLRWHERSICSSVVTLVKVYASYISRERP